MNKYLIINAGSSSLKFSLYKMPEEKVIVSGCVEKIGKKDSFYLLNDNGNKIKHDYYVRSHQEAVDVMLTELLKNHFINNIDEIEAVGNRVLHGGEFYSESVIIDDEALNSIRSLTKLGPLHHPGEIACIIRMQEIIPNAVQVAVFDTAFHQTIPKENYMYPVPHEWYEENGVRKYGFHGTSHKYITKTMQNLLAKDDVNLIICHIGSGASISAIKEGKCYDTTMGLTPLAGLMMGTRSGDIDPSIIDYISHERNMSVDEVNEALNKKSGLLGIAGKNDLRDLEELAANGSKKAKLAIDMFENSIIKYIGSYYFELDGNVDAIVFTAGVGENSMVVRKGILDKIAKPLGSKFNEKMNNIIAGFKDIHSGIITTQDSKVPVFVIPTNEEKMILDDTYELVTKPPIKSKQKCLNTKVK